MPGILPPAERRSVVLVTVYAALSLLLLVVGEHLPVAWMRGTGAFVFAPFDRMVLTGDRLFAAWRENTALHQRIARLELELAQLRIEGGENRRLRAQLALPDWRGLPMTPVEVLALSGDPMPTAATLSAGLRDGVHLGDALMTRDGLVGRITEAWPRLSRAALLTDPNQAIACEVETTGVNGILRVTLVAPPAPDAHRRAARRHAPRGRADRHVEPVAALSARHPGGPRAPRPPRRLGSHAGSRGGAGCTALAAATGVRRPGSADAGGLAGCLARTSSSSPVGSRSHRRRTPGPASPARGATAWVRVTPSWRRERRGATRWARVRH